MYRSCQAVVHTCRPVVPTTQPWQVGGVRNIHDPTSCRSSRWPRRQWPLPMLTCRWRRTWRYLALCLIVVWHSTDTSQRWHEPATTTPGPSSIFVTCCPMNSPLLWPAGRYCIGWTTATLCCTVLQSALSSIQKLQRVQNTAARIVTQSPRAHPLPTTAGSYTASCSSTNQVQAGRADIQDPSFVNPSVPDRPSHFTSSSFLRRAFTAQTYYQNSLCRPCFLLYCSYSVQSWIRLAMTLSPVGYFTCCILDIILKTLFRQTFWPSRFSRP